MKRQASKFGGALDPGIDLLDALNLHSNLSQYPGVTITPSRVFHLSESCYITKKDFEHGEIQILGCRNCSCVDGNMHCEFLQCPELKCPPEQQMSVTDECCKFCQGISSFPLILPTQDHIFLEDTHQQPRQQPHHPQQQGNLNRHEEQEQVSFQVNHFQQYEHNEQTNLHNSSSKTEPSGDVTSLAEVDNDEKTIADGFGVESNSQLIGEILIDQNKNVDECTQQGGLNGNHCHLNTRCVNTFGSYICECLPGYRRQDKFNCVEMDECKSGEHNCHENADCINTLGSYHCQCKEGYTGNGRDCKRTSASARLDSKPKAKNV
uniref:EGF-like domain-containing protein n=1 Tax=Anopheles culicifacies TaxID=139723 RepID=A0A182MN14_9DIPT